MKTLIVYSSKSGNTKRLAESVHDFLPGTNTLQKVEEKPDPAGYDLVIVGFWLQAGKADPMASEYLGDLPPSKVFLFATHGAAVGSAHAEKGMQNAKDLIASCTIAGTFSCQGEVRPEFLAKVQKKDPPPPWIGDAPAAAGHPDAADVENLKKAIEGAVG
jgi:flavodoxin